MTARDDRIYDEAAALWREVFGEPPPVRADGLTLLEVITRSLPDKGYDRLTSPHLRPSQISRPRRQRSGADAQRGDRAGPRRGLESRA